ncbi:hypothetical protein EHW67_12415, partial [Arenibacter aquaticus]
MMKGLQKKGGGLSMTVPERQQSAARRDTGIDHASGVPYFGYGIKKKSPHLMMRGLQKKGGGLLSH